MQNAEIIWGNIYLHLDKHLIKGWPALPQPLTSHTSNSLLNSWVIANSSGRNCKVLSRKIFKYLTCALKKKTIEGRLYVMLLINLIFTNSTLRKILYYGSKQPFLGDLRPTSCGKTHTWHCNNRQVTALGQTDYYYPAKWTRSIKPILAMLLLCLGSSTSLNPHQGDCFSVGGN